MTPSESSYIKERESILVPGFGEPGDEELAFEIATEVIHPSWCSHAALNEECNGKPIRFDLEIAKRLVPFIREHIRRAKE